MTSPDLYCYEDLDDDDYDDKASQLDSDELALLLDTLTPPPPQLKLNVDIDFMMLRLYQGQLRQATSRAPDTRPASAVVPPSTCQLFYTTRSARHPAWLTFEYSLDQPFTCVLCGTVHELCIFIAQGYLELVWPYTLPENKPQTLLAVCESCYVHTIEYEFTLCEYCQTQLTLFEKCIYCEYYFGLFQKYLDVYTYRGVAM